MKLLYISVHSVLEYDELKLLSELGHDVFSLGAYSDPKGHYQLPRPSLEEHLKDYPEYREMVAGMPRTELSPEFLNLFDATIIMHSPDILIQNNDVFKSRVVIWRSIGQSTPTIEKRITSIQRPNLKVMRYSPMEKKIPSYAGNDAIIRFYKDPEEFHAWTGTDAKVINLSQALKGRREFCRYEPLMKVAEGFPFKVYGPGNEDLGDLDGGSLPYELMKGQLRDARVYLYGGTWPASYTLGFIEAWMTGTPVVALGPEHGDLRGHEGIRTYEIQKLMDNKHDGVCSDSHDTLRKYIQKLLEDHSFAEKMSDAGRESAIALFGKETIGEQWKKFLGEL